jgi:hypothetical protein
MSDGRKKFVRLTIRESGAHRKRILDIEYTSAGRSEPGGTRSQPIPNP